MPGPYTYPGVYIEEIPSGVRTITGVSTSETAFVDYFGRGPMDQAVRVTSYAEFERAFGGLHIWSEGSYAIRQFYLNGGQIAWIVRVPAGNPGTAKTTLFSGSPVQPTLEVSAANPGKWGSGLQVAVTSGTTPPLFNLFVREVETSGGQVQVKNSEAFRNLSMSLASSRYAVRVVNDGSALIRLADDSTGQVPLGFAAAENGGPPNNAWQQLSPGSDGNPRDSLGVPTSSPAFASALKGTPGNRSGMYALDAIEPFIFNILCFPSAPDLGASAAGVYSDARTYCEDKRAFLLVDIPQSVQRKGDMIPWMLANDGLRSKNAAVYFPRVQVIDPLNDGRPRDIASSGTLAGVYARTDSDRGVWKAPAGTDADLRGVTLTSLLTDLDNGSLNPLGINALRNFPIFGQVSWGARTLDGADQKASEWKYIPVRRMALFLEESLFQGSKWIVFEPNDERLWSQVRLNFGAFMQNLFRQGAFQGKSPHDAYFVKCDSETTNQTDINSGIVNIVVGFAPLKPAEFVIIKIQQMAGQIAV